MIVMAPRTDLLAPLTMRLSDYMHSAVSVLGRFAGKVMKNLCVSALQNHC